ncbi:hypothetical protein VNO77_26920 [Canavalia gladiata]|uniref:Uncharacterized protein n=1 Tax=Canavalia gladiata TaxID=3824 RepID=A0AAN9Q609_CANGL
MVVDSGLSGKASIMHDRDYASLTTYYPSDHGVSMKILWVDDLKLERLFREYRLVFRLRFLFVFVETGRLCTHREENSFATSSQPSSSSFFPLNPNRGISLVL